MYTFNFWAILVASAAAFAISALWYSPVLFGKEWMALTKMKDSSNMNGSKMWGSYIIHFIVSIVTFCVLGFGINAAGVSNGQDGAFLGAIIWLGFIATIGVSEILWKKTPIKLVLIDTFNSLITLVIGGAIIGAWR
jgi:hypothetical protein